MAESKRHMDVPKERVLEKSPHRCLNPMFDTRSYLTN